MKPFFNERARIYGLIMVIVLAVSALACRTVLPQSSPTEPPVLLATLETITEPTSIEIEEPAVVPSPIMVDEESALVQLYMRVNPAVVNITALINQDGEMTGYSEGSGFLIDSSGNIVTNAHVVHGAEALEVTFSNALTVPAELVGEDFSSDLAVVQVVELPEDIMPLELGDDSTVLAGQTVVAIGNPFGLEGTMTRGIVSAIGRTIPALNTFRIPKAIQTDASINPGNSGGPLLNLNGQVIGVNAQIRTEGEDRSNSGVGFAIPVSLIKRVAPALIADGKYTWPWLGVVGGDLTWITARAMDLPVNQGAYLSQIVEGGPSDKAGLRGSTGQETYENRTVEVGGDVIIAINGQSIHSFDELLIYVALETSPGETITMTVLRDGVEQQVSVTLEPRPEELTFPFQPEEPSIEP